MTVVTRIAPSPTGYLHIGGARTALFNWLFARHHGGTFRLRIEDTDRVRSTREAIDAILDGLGWLGIDWDGDVVYQSRNAERHRELALALLEAGEGYRCYATPDELAEMRKKARAAGTTRLYDGRWRDRDPADAPLGMDPVVRIKIPLDGETVIEDDVQGTVRVANDHLDDFVLLRADGTPTYMLAVVADDHDMGITHVIRGDDHLSNAPRQYRLYRALGWEAPRFAHIPLIHGPDGRKLSKRHGALGVDAYRDMGYMPEAMRNYLARLGWSHGDDEIFTIDQAVRWFGLDAVGRSPAQFDLARLDSLNAHYIRAADDRLLVDQILPKIADLLGQPPDDAVFERLIKGMGSLKQRAKTLVELIDNAMIYCRSVPLQFSEKAARLLDREGLAHLAGLEPRLRALEHWAEPELEAAIREYCEAAGVKLGSVAQPLRAALTGSTVSPGIFEVMEVLGRNEAVARVSAVAD